MSSLNASQMIDKHIQVMQPNQEEEDDNVEITSFGSSGSEEQ